MLRILRQGDGRETDAILDQIYRLRHRVFHERLGWDVRSVSGRETDEFDELNTYYAAYLNEKGQLLGTWRVVPSLGPNMLRDVFPMLLDGRHAPASPKLWEMSRFAVDEELLASDPGQSQFKAVIHLFYAALLFGERRNISSVLVVHDAPMARLVERVLGVKALWSTKQISIGDTLTSAAIYPRHSSEAYRLKHNITDVYLDCDEYEGKAA